MAAFCGTGKSTIESALTTRCCFNAARSIERAAFASQQVYLAFDYTQSFYIEAVVRKVSGGLDPE